MKKINKNKIIITTREKDSEIQIRVQSRLKDWLKKKGYSPTKIFYEAVKSLGWK